jgi:hypothetical protein
MPYSKEEYPLPREYECDGSHSSLNMKDEGPLEVYICADPCCAHVTARCTHIVKTEPGATDDRGFRFIPRGFLNGILMAKSCPVPTADRMELNGERHISQTEGDHEAL